MWQPAIIPQSILARLTVGADPIIGKPYPSRKAARLEARRMAASFAVQLGERLASYTEEALNLMRVNELVDIYTRGSEHQGVIVVRWQPGDEAGD